MLCLSVSPLDNARQDCLETVSTKVEWLVHVAYSYQDLKLHRGCGMRSFIDSSIEHVMAYLQRPEGFIMLLFRRCNETNETYHVVLDAAMKSPKFVTE
jgi:hypothetical protein